MTDIATKYKVEIQLRTFLQDVWGEIEHTISYKQGNIHPHIKESFLLLANELSTKDRQLSYLKKIKDKEGSIELLSRRMMGLQPYLCFEDDIKPKFFEENEKVKNLVQNYEKLIHSSGIESTKEEKDNITTLYDNIVLQTKAYDSSISVNMEKLKIEFWIEMEKAYFDLCNYEFDKVLTIYKTLLSKDKFFKKYMPLFRMGEIYFVKGKIEEALQKFDETEELIRDEKCNCTFENKYKINKKIARCYLLLGNQYLDVVLKKIDEADKYSKLLNIDFREKDKINFLSLKCYANLSKFVANWDEWEEDIKKEEKKYEYKYENDKYYAEAGKAFSRLKDLIENSDSDAKSKVSSNVYDTLAWFCYQKYLSTKEKADLDESKKHCKEMLNRKNESDFQLTSMNTHIDHYETIMSMNV